MRGIRAAWVVFAFEWRRAMGWGRLPFMAALAVFPAAILWLIRHEGGRLEQHADALAIVLFALVPEIVCLLGLLLWATPMIHSDVENKTWPYLAVRPAGKTPILFGKYAAAVLWTMLTGWLALGVCLLVLLPGQRGAPPWAVIAAFGTFGGRSSAKLSTPDDECIFQQTTALKILQQRSDPLIAGFGEFGVPVDDVIVPGVPSNIVAANGM